VAGCGIAPTAAATAAAAAADISDKTGEKDRRQRSGRATCHDHARSNDHQH